MHGTHAINVHEFEDRLRFPYPVYGRAYLLEPGNTIIKRGQSLDANPEQPEAEPTSNASIMIVKTTSTVNSTHDMPSTRRVIVGCIRKSPK